jgi:HEPN domain-containing protein
MNDFSKLKIGFALALLCSIFALNPLIEHHLTKGFELYTLTIPLLWPFLGISITLGITVYLYALTLISDKTNLDILRNLGNYIYTIALIIPPLYIVLFIVSLVAKVLECIFKIPDITKIVEIFFIAIIAFISPILIVSISKVFKSKDRIEKINNLTKIEIDLLAKSRKLSNDGYYDMAIIDAWKAIEVAFSKAFINANHKIEYRVNLIEVAKKSGFLNNTLYEDLNYIQDLRNQTAHTNNKVSKNDAEKVLSITDKVISELEKEFENCYYCNKKYPKKEMKSDEMEIDYVCKSCAKNNPDWKVELLSKWD